MNLSDVIDVLVDERGLEKEKVIAVVCGGIEAAYAKKFPDLDLVVSYNSRSGQAEVFARKTIVSHVEDRDAEISLRSARTISPKAEVGEIIEEPLKEEIGRIEILTAKQVIAQKIRGLEQAGVYEEFKPKEGTLINGMVHKSERAGTVVKVGESMAFLPRSCSIPDENLRVGYPIRALLKEVLPESPGDHQLILDRASTDFVARLLEVEIPEIFEGIVEVKKIVRAAGYKSKIIVASNSGDIDPVGTCVGVGGVRIKPILKEIGREKIDLIEETDNPEKLIEQALKPAEIDKVELNIEGTEAIIMLAQDQRSFAIGKLGQNIALASKLTGVDIHLQDEATPTEGNLDFSGTQEVSQEGSSEQEESQETGQEISSGASGEQSDDTDIE